MKTLDVPNRMHDYYYNVVNQGCELNYQKLSLNIIHRKWGNDRTSYQVHCEDRREEVSGLFNNLAEAVTEFLRIKKILDKNQ